MCVCVHVYVCACACMHVYVCTCMCMHMCVCEVGSVRGERGNVYIIRLAAYQYAYENYFVQISTESKVMIHSFRY